MFKYCCDYQDASFRLKLPYPEETIYIAILYDSMSHWKYEDTLIFFKSFNCHASVKDTSLLWLIKCAGSFQSPDIILMGN